MPKPIKNIPPTPKEIEIDPIVPYKLGGQVKPTLPKSTRGNDVSLKGDDTKDFSIGLKDIDSAIIYYFDNVIKPSIIENGQRIKVPITYAFPERWEAAQKNEHLRDKMGRILAPLIMFRRDNIQKNRDLGNKLDGNESHLYQVVEKKYSNKNHYDRFSVINNRIPVREFYKIVVPDYVTITYNCAIFTNSIEHLNKIIESINFASDSYWGDLSRFKFKSRIDSYSSITEYSQGEDRVVRSNFDIVLNGYIIPESINRDAALTKKTLSTAQVLFTFETVDGDLNNLNIFKEAERSSAKNANYMGQGISLTKNYIISTGDFEFLNINITKAADIVTTDTATFTGASFAQPAITSSIPRTGVNNFSIFINGQYIPNIHVTSMTETTAGVEIVFNTTTLTYTLEADDEVIAVGKFNP
jgi:hypothetical protein